MLDVVLGIAVGATDRLLLSALVGANDGAMLGALLGTPVGATVASLGTDVGANDGHRWRFSWSCCG